MNWRRSTRCGEYGCNDCVEVARDGTMHVRDSVLGNGSPILSFGQGAFRSLVQQIKSGELDRAATTSHR